MYTCSTCNLFQYKIWEMGFNSFFFLSKWLPIYQYHSLNNSSSLMEKYINTVNSNIYIWVSFWSYSYIIPTTLSYFNYCSFRIYFTTCRKSPCFLLFFLRDVLAILIYLFSNTFAFHKVKIILVFIHIILKTKLGEIDIFVIWTIPLPKWEYTSLRSPCIKIQASWRQDSVFFSAMFPASRTPSDIQ